MLCLKQTSGELNIKDSYMQDIYKIKFGKNTGFLQQTRPAADSYADFNRFIGMLKLLW